MRIQTALEFLLTYSWAFVIIGLAVAVVFLTIMSPIQGTTVSPSYCYIEPSLPCSQAAIVSNSNSTQFYVVFQNNLGITMQFQSDALEVVPSINLNKSTGSCYPSTAPQGAIVTCNATISSKPTALGAQFNPTFTINYELCSPTCVKNTYGTTGTAVTFSRPLSSFVLVSLFVNPSGAGKVALNGVQYPSGSNVLLSLGTHYTLYAVNNPRYTFSSWACSGTGCYSGSNQMFTLVVNNAMTETAEFTSTSSSTSSTTSSTVSSTTSTSTTSTSTSSTATTTVPSTYIYAVGSYPNASAIGSMTNSTYFAGLGSGGIGAWTQTATLPIKFNPGHGCNIYNNYIYCVGFAPTGGSNNLSFYAPISSSGIGSWQSTTRIPYINGSIVVLMNNQGCSIFNGYIYCIGAETQGTYVNIYAPVSSSGIGGWSETSSFPSQTGGGYETSCAVNPSYIYCVGLGGFNNSYYAGLGSSGIEAWTKTTPYPLAATGGETSCTIYNGYIYCIDSGVQPHNQSYYASVSSQGIGAWEKTTSYPLGSSNKLDSISCDIYNGYIYCIGGTTDNVHSAAYYAPVSSSGIGSWQSTTQFPGGLINAWAEVSGYGGGGLFSGGGLSTGTTTTSTSTSTTSTSSTSTSSTSTTVTSTTTSTTTTTSVTSSSTSTTTTITWSVTLSSSGTQTCDNQVAYLTATASQTVTGTPYDIFIYNGTHIVATCTTGSTCSFTFVAESQAATISSYSFTATIGNSQKTVATSSQVTELTYPATAVTISNTNDPFAGTISQVYNSGNSKGVISTGISVTAQDYYCTSQNLVNGACTSWTYASASQTTDSNGAFSISLPSGAEIGTWCVNATSQSPYCSYFQDGGTTNTNPAGTYPDAPTICFTYSGPEVPP